MELVQQHNTFPLAPLQKIGPYRIKRLYQKSTSHSFYLCSHPVTNKTLFIKTISSQQQEEPALRSFFNEGKILLQSNHPNIVDLHHHGAWEGGFFTAMEWIRGSSLQALLDQGNVSTELKLEILMQTAYALGYLHCKSIVYQALHPKHILITKQHRVKLIDFSCSTKPNHQYTPSDDIHQLCLIASRMFSQEEHRTLPSLADIFSKGLHQKKEMRYRDSLDFISSLSKSIKAFHTSAYQKEKPPICPCPNRLLLTKAPIIQGAHCDLFFHRKEELQKLYLDIFPLFSHLHMIALAEPLSGKESVSLTDLAMLKGALLALTRHPTFNRKDWEIEQLSQSFSEMLPRDLFEGKLALTLLFLNPQQHHFSFFTHGPTALKIISKKILHSSSLEESHQRIKWMPHETIWLLSKYLHLPNNDCNKTLSLIQSFKHCFEKKEIGPGIALSIRINTLRSKEPANHHVTIHSQRK